MNFRRKIAVSLLLCTALCGVAFAQVVDIPDPILRAAVMERLQLTTPPTQADMLRLTDLRKHWAEIESLRGLEHAVNLTRLDLEGHRFSDITPLAGLRNLEWLKLPWNAIKDISPLAGLTNLQYLEISHNLITDVDPLTGLANLRHLIIHNNLTLDHAALDNLALDTFIYDQICDMPPLPLEPRLKNRSFPSIFASFNSVIVNRRDELLETYDDFDAWIARPRITTYFLTPVRYLVNRTKKATEFAKFTENGILQAICPTPWICENVFLHSTRT